MHTRPASRRRAVPLVVATIVALTAAARASQGALAVQPPDPVPVIDMHMHSLGPAGNAAMLAAMDSLGVRVAAFIGTPSMLAERPADAGGRTLLPSLTFPCEGGRMPTSGVRCFPDGSEWPSVDSLRAWVRRGEVRLFGEVNAQYMGVSPDDARLEPYYALAEELDIPVGIHLGIGAPGVAYAESRFPPHKSPNYRGAAGDPLALEAVLTRHPRLRVYVMHAAWPFRDDLIYLMYMHPRLHADLSVLQWAIPRPAYLAHLRALVDAGFAKRLMFGSDGSARQLRMGVDAILTADFLTPEQKRDILHDNAARFLRLP